MRSIDARGRPLSVDDETAKLLDFAAALWRMSEARSTSPPACCATPGRSTKGRARAPGTDRAAAPSAGSGELEPPVLRLPAGMQIDFGGIGKEYAVDLVADGSACAADTPVLVNFGGDLRCSGRPPQAGGWKRRHRIARAGGEAVRRIELQPARSRPAATQRHIVIAGDRYAHISMRAPAGPCAMRRAR